MPNYHSLTAFGMSALAPLLAHGAAARLLLIGSDDGTAAIKAILEPDRYSLSGVADLDAAMAAMTLQSPSLIVLILATDDADGHA